MAHAVRPFDELSHAMNHTLAVETNTINIAIFLRHVTLTIKVENIWRQMHAKKFREACLPLDPRAETDNNFPKRTFEYNCDYCENYRRKGYKTRKCRGKRPRPVHHVKPALLGKCQAN